MKVRISAVLAGAVLTVVAGVASADSVNDRMRDMFGGYNNVTKPGVVEGATRGVVTGGNVTIRHPIKTMGGWSFDPPSVTTGCGGIDLYGGNLSFPDKEQYVQMGRAIIGNIGGAAFRMALRQTCELCDSIMSSIQDTVNALNFDNMSSCQIANQMVEAGANGENPFGWAAESGRNVAASWRETFGDSPDRITAYNSGRGNESPVQRAMNDPQMAEILQGNLVWKGLIETGAADWLGDSDMVREEVMSLIGAVVSCAPDGSDNCLTESDSGDAGTWSLPPTLTLLEYASLEGEGSDRYDVYSCGSGSDCLKPQRVQRSFGKPVAQRIVDAYLGVDGHPGILQRGVMPATMVGDFTAFERGMLANTSNLGAKAFACTRAGANGQGHARFIIEGMAPQIAAETLHTGLSQIISVLQRYVSERSQHIAAASTKEMLEQSSRQLLGQLNEIRAKTNSSDILAQALDRCTAPVFALDAVG